MSASVSRRRVLKLAGGAAAALGLSAGVTEYGAREASAAQTGPAGPHASALTRAAVPRATATARRVTAWAAAPVPPSATGRSATGFRDALVRMVVRPTVGGTHPRIRLSNRHGTAPLRVAGAWIAVRGQGAQEQAGTRVAVTFGGAHDAVVQPGGELVGDPVPMPVPVTARTVLLVTVEVSGSTGPTTWHPRSRDATYVLDGPARLLRSSRAPARRWRTAVGWYWLSGLDLLSTTAAGTVVCFGDSITDGPATSLTRSTVRWPDLLAARLAGEHPDAPYGVVDLGIAGNRLLGTTATGGVSALERFDQDALVQAGATDLFLLEGINDIGAHTDAAGQPVTADELITAQRTLIDRARRAGLAVHGCTLLPYEGAKYYTTAGEEVRLRLNEWIRSGGEFDSVVDFERAVRDPLVPKRFAVPYDSGDHLHPSDAGQAALADAVQWGSLSKLRR